MHLSAIRHQETFIHGRSRPMLIVAEESADGPRHEIVLKLSTDVQGGRTGLAVEMICAGLAECLALKAARATPIDITEGFAASVPDADARRRLMAAPGLHFGSAYHAGQYHLPLADDSLTDSLLDSAAAVMLFDAMTGNDDRHREKPNCLLRGDDIVIIDHERALPCLRDELRPAAWEHGGLAFVRNHAFFHGLRGQLPDFAGAARAWKTLTPSVAASLVSQVPFPWLDEPKRARATHFLIEMSATVDKVSGLLTEMLR